MSQLVNPDLTVSGRIGYCLEYASRLVFHNPAAGTTAWDAWQATQFKHLDQSFPTLSFPVWFSGAAGAGHVAIYTPSGIYSSPYKTQTGHNVLTSIAEVERLYGVKYVGWSKDILGLKVIKEEDAVPPDYKTNRGDVINFYLNMLGRNPSEDEINAYLNKPWKEVTEAFWASDEYKNRLNGDFVPVSEQLFKKKG